MKKFSCTSCGHPKEAKEFNKDAANINRGGCRYICRDCEKKEREEKRQKKTKPIDTPIELKTVVSYSFEAQNGDRLLANDIGKQGITVQLLMRGVDPDELSGIHIPKSLLPVFISVKFRKWLSGIVCQLEARG